MKTENNKLKQKFIRALLALTIALCAVVTSTFAWYIYNTSAHTTNVSMAAGSATSLLISDAYDGEYGYSVSLMPFTGKLSPVSTDIIQDGSRFQQVTRFEKIEGRDPSIVATVFDNAPTTDYYKRTLYLKSKGDSVDVYVRNIGYRDSNPQNPISSAIRVGLVVYKPGNSGVIDNEYIFEINPYEHVEKPSYNTSTGEDGYVLNSTTRDNTTIKFNPLTPKNYCGLNKETNEVIIEPGKSKKIATCPGGSNGDPVKVDVYIWLEGCDKDCTLALAGTTLKEVSVEFAGNIEN